MSENIYPESLSSPSSISTSTMSSSSNSNNSSSSSFSSSVITRKSINLQRSIAAPSNHELPWYERQQTSRQVSNVLYILSSTLLGMFAWKWQRGSSNWRIGLFSGSIVSLITGVYLRHRTFLKDPVALEKYREWIDEHSVGDTLDYFGRVHKVKKIMGKENFRMKTHQELMDKGFHEVFTEVQIARFEELLSQSCVDPSFIRDAFINDLNYQDITGIELIRRLAQYGSWLCVEVDFSSEYLSNILRDHSSIQSLDFHTIWEAGGHYLVRDGILDLDFIRSKFEAQYGSIIRNRGLSYVWKHIPDLQKIIELKVISPSDLAPAAYIERADHHTSISDYLLKFWKWPLSQYRNDIIPNRDESAKLQSLYDELSVCLDWHNANIRDAKAQYDTATSKAQQTKKKKLKELKQNNNNNKNNNKNRESNQKQKQKQKQEIESEYSQDVKAASEKMQAVKSQSENTLERNKQRIDAEWKRWFSERKK